MVGQSTHFVHRGLSINVETQTGARLSLRSYRAVRLLLTAAAVVAVYPR